MCYAYQKEMFFHLLDVSSFYAQKIGRSQGIGITLCGAVFSWICNNWEDVTVETFCLESSVPLSQRSSMLIVRERGRSWTVDGAYMGMWAPFLFQNMCAYKRGPA